MQYCIYLRKSRADTEAEARGEGETLTRHKAALLDLARRQNLSIKQIYREIVSGDTIAARPIVQQLLSEVGQGVWTGVLVMEIERLARGDTIDQGIIAQTFKFTGTKIITPMKTYDPMNEFDEEYFEFGLFMSRREYKTINRRLQRGRIASVREGKYIASRPPYGYRRKKIENDRGYTLEPLPEQAEIVRRIFEFYILGELQPDGTRKRLGISLIARRLNTLDIPPQRSDTWAAVSIRDILINPVYFGRLRWNWRPTAKKIVDGQIKIERPRNLEKCFLAEGQHEPIIDEETFHAAQKIMSSNPKKTMTERKNIKNPLCGLVICGICGRKMVRRPYPAELNRPDTLMCANASCKNISSSLPLVEERILTALGEWLDGYKLNWDSGNTHKRTTGLDIKKKTLKKLETEINTLNVQMDNIYDLLELGVYNTDEFQERKRKICGRIRQKQEARDTLLTDLKSDQSYDKNNKIPNVDRLLDVYYTLHSPKAKYELLKEVLEKVIYFKDKNGRWHNSPDNFEVILYPRLPHNKIL